MPGYTKSWTGRKFLIACTCFGLLLAGCNSDTAEGPLDTSRLPRVSGAKEVYASAPTTIFTSPISIPQTADSVEKALKESGWQKFSAPNSGRSENDQIRMLSMKRGMQGLSVSVMAAPAQNNATSVQYAVLPLKTDLPFTKDASNIEYSPDKPVLSLVTSEPIDKTLEFYRKEMDARGWSVWSEKTNGKQAASEPAGIVHERGAYAYYISDKNPSGTLVLTLQKADGGKLKAEIKEWPIKMLASVHQAYLNGDNSHAPLTDVTKLPRLAGAQEQADRSSQDRVVYSAPGSVEETAAATRKMLAADGWKEYAAPLEKRGGTLLAFKKGGQGLSVSFTMTGGKADQSSVYYSPTRIRFAIPFPADASDIVFDDNRPYLSLNTAGTADAIFKSFDKQLLDSGWSHLSASDTKAKWPNANLDEKPAGSSRAYFIRGTRLPIMLTARPSGDAANIEIKVAPFAEPQTLEAGDDIFGLPRPKLTKTAGGTGGQTTREMHAHVPAGIGAVLAFYRRELSAKSWKEETDGAVVTPDEVLLNYSFADGSAQLKLGHEYDLTTVSLVQRINKPAVSEAPKTDSLESMLKEAQQMARDLTAKSPQPSNEPAEKLSAFASSEVLVPLPNTAADVEFDGGNGKLEFSSTSNVKSVAEFYRDAMKKQGWKVQPSVINNPNMAVLDFSKGGKSVNFTILKMGAKTNVSANGSGLKMAGAQPAPDKSSGNAVVADTSSPAATEDDLIAEESGGLPVPKRRTAAVSDKSQFRRQLEATVPLSINDVLGFYRRELGKRNWKEESGAVVAADRAKLSFTSAEGPGTLTLSRKDGATIVHLVTRNPEAAAKAGIVAKPGQVKLLISNPNDVEAVLVINKQTIKAAAGSGIKAPDGPMLDLPPGKYKFSVKLAGKPAHNDELEVGADQTWGIFIGPGGALPLHVY
jgi:hypothetical protein